MSETTETTTAVTVSKPAAPIPFDNGRPVFFNPAMMDQLWRAAKVFSMSDLVPTAYKNKPENCFIAIELADRMGIAPFAVLQNLVIIQGKPSMEAKLIIALVNDSGVFTDPLDFEVIGDDPYPAPGTKPELHGYKVRAFATMKKSGKLCQGPWVTYRMVVGEGWLDKGGSKWKTMPDLMFRYRAASFFAKLYCPNITMGMQTREEMEDVITIEQEPVAGSNVRQIESMGIDQTGQSIHTETEEQKTRKRRTKAEIEADRAKEQAAAVAAADAGSPERTGDGTGHPSISAESETINTETGEVSGGAPIDDDDSFPDPPGGPVADNASAGDDEDLF